MSQADQNQSPKVGVYICHCGGNISDHVNIDQVEKDAAGLPGVCVARQNSFMCSDPGQEMIIEDIKSGRVDRVVVASCAPSLHETTFRGALTRAGLNPYLYEHANIREQVSWVHHGPGATAKASHLVGAAVAKAAKLRSLAPVRVDAARHATVIGGGVAGLKAAGELARQGVKVTLVERTPFLGGHLAGLDRLFPRGEAAAEVVAGLYEPLAASELVEVLTCAEVTACEGYVGNFSLTVRQEPPSQPAQLSALARFHQANGDAGGFVTGAGLLPSQPPAEPREHRLASGALVLATGFSAYQPRRGEFGHGEHPQVVTLAELTAALEGQAPGATPRVGGRPVGSLAIIHCVGSRHIPGVYEAPDGTCHEYCSRTCCTAALHTALELRRRFPGTVVHDLHRDIRAYGRGHEDLYREASRNQVRFLRFGAEDPPVVGAAGDGLTVTVKELTLGGEEVAMAVDLVVLATGMEPGPVGPVAEMLKLAQGADGFLLEVHPKLRPVEPAVGGVYLAGTCQAPMDSTEAVAAAGAAAAKAAAILRRGYVELDPFVARVDPAKCQGHGLCAAACIAEGALEMRAGDDGAPRPHINPALCLGCGVCVAACPEEAIDVAGWTLDQYRDMVAALTAGGAPTTEEASHV